MLRIPHYLDNGLTDSLEFVNFTLRPHSNLQKQFYFCGIHFCQRLSKPQELLRPQGLGKSIKTIYFAGSRTRDLPITRKQINSEGTSCATDLTQSLASYSDTQTFCYYSIKSFSPTAVAVPGSRYDLHVAIAGRQCDNHTATCRVVLH
jgi:hypothetical protein